MPTRIASGVVCVLLSVAYFSAAALGSDLPAWTATIRADHPRLFFNKETWPEVRARALGAEREWYESVKADVDRFMATGKRGRERHLIPPNESVVSRDFGVMAAQAAFVFRVTDDPRYLNLARTCLRTSIEFYETCFKARIAVDWYSTSRVHATMAWDWLYDHLDENERVELMSRLVQVIDKVITAKPAIYRENIGGYDTGFYGVDNCPWFIGCTAFGTGIQPEKVDQWLVWGHDENLKMLEHRKKACGDDGGGGSPSLGYVFGAYPWSEQNFFYTWRSATGENIAPDWPHGAWLANYVIWNWIDAPRGPYEFGYGDTPHTTNRMHTAQLYTHMANIRNLYGQSAPEAAALARYIQQRLPQRRYSKSWFVYPFLLSQLEKSPPPLAPEKLPRGRNFEGMGQVFMRSGPGPDDTYCLFSCGGMLFSHRHYDALNFVIYHRGFLALDSGTRFSQFENGQHLANYYAQTVAHNCVLIHQPGEPAARYWGGKVEGNYGGQHHELGSVLKAFETNDRYVYVAGDATTCYQHGGKMPQKCSLVTRQLVFLTPNHFVICDRVVSTKPEYRKEWLLHSAHEPTVFGNTFRVDHLNGRLFCQTILPADARLTPVGGPGKEFWAGKNWAIAKGKLKPEELAMMGQWRVEVTPGQPRTNDVFLHVIQVGDPSLDEMDKVERIEQTGMCGARVHSGDAAWEVTFNTTGDLGGHIRRVGSGPNVDRDLSTNVQPQSGI